MKKIMVSRYHFYLAVYVLPETCGDKDVTKAFLQLTTPTTETYYCPLHKSDCSLLTPKKTYNY